MNSRTAEDSLIDDVAGFTQDPLGYVRYAFDWGHGDLKNHAGPRKWQAEKLEQISRHLRSGSKEPLQLAVASGHGIGKSALIAMIANWGLSTFEDCRIVVTANTENQLRTKTWPEISKWARLAINSHWWNITATAITAKDKQHERSWRADAHPWSEHNTEAFAGLHNKGKRIIVITDESSKIADKVWEVIEGALTDEGTEIIWIAFGNPTLNTGRFRECWGKFRNLWNTKQIDSRDVEGTNKAYLDELVKTYGEDSDIVKVRVRGMFPSASSMQFIGTDLVERARRVDIGFIDPGEPLVMGVDVARFGDDHSTIYFRRGRDARSIAPVRLSQVDTMQLAAKVAELYRLHRAQMVSVDGGGIGAGVVDRLKQMGLPVAEVQFGAKPLNAVRLANGVKCANRRAEIWAIMREWLEGGAIPDDQMLCDDLTGVEYSFNARDEIQLEKKEHMKERGLASPDDGDGLALTFAVPVVPSTYEDEHWETEHDDRGEGGY